MVPRLGLETNEAANEATFVSVLLAGAFVDSISPTLGSIRAFFGIFCVCCGLPKKTFVQRQKKIAAFVKYSMGQQRNRTSMYLKPTGLKRPYKSWDERRTKKRAKKEV